MAVFMRALSDGSAELPTVQVMQLLVGQPIQLSSKQTTHRNCMRVEIVGAGSYHTMLSIIGLTTSPIFHVSAIDCREAISMWS